MKKTLGGDRLGAGKKMEVDLHGYSRSTHDLSYLWRSTMSPGTLVPYMSEIALPGDTFDIDLDCDIKTHPTIGPLFGSYKVQLDVFFAPLRLYNALLHNNKLGIGMKMNKVFLPVIELEADQQDLFDPTTTPDIDNAQINPSCVLSYLGIRGVGFQDSVAGTIPRQFNGVPLLAYHEIYKQYYANKMETNGYVIHNGGGGGIVSGYNVNGQNLPVAAGVFLTQASDFVKLFWQSGTAPNLDYIMFETNVGWLWAKDLFTSWVIDNGGGTNWLGRLNYPKYHAIYVYAAKKAGAGDSVPVSPTATPFPLENIDAMRESLLAFQSTTQPFKISDYALEPYMWYCESGTSLNRLASQEGLLLKTYQSDLFNNWLQTEYIDGPTGINAITAVDTSSGSFTIDQITLARKVYDMLNRIAVSGGTYDDWLDAVYTNDRYRVLSTPAYLGGLIKELAFQEVISNTQSPDQPLGTLGGRGVLTKKHKGGKVVVKVDEPGYIIGIISLTPRIDYSQGNKWDVHLKTMDDLHKPQLDEIGFQDLITEQMAWWDTQYIAGTTNDWITRSAGKQPAWINYMTNTNRTLGNFAIKDNEMFMTLNRRYEAGVYGAGNRGIIDLTTYIDPVKFNFVFAETALDAQNFWAQIAVNITARRKMSAKVMPNL